jgi:hypothetical protein
MAAITEKNIKAGFCGAGSVPLNPDIVLSKMDIQLRTPTPSTTLPNITYWTSQTPHNPAEAIAQSTLVERQLNDYRGGFPTPIIGAVTSLTKGTERLAYELAIVQAEIHSLREANNMLSKRRRTEKVQLQCRGTLTVQQGLDLMKGNGNRTENQAENASEGGGAQPEALSSRRCSKYTKLGHNIRTCQMDL